MGILDNITNRNTLLRVMHHGSFQPSPSYTHISMHGSLTGGAAFCFQIRESDEQCNLRKEKDPDKYTSFDLKLSVRHAVVKPLQAFQVQTMNLSSVKKNLNEKEKNKKILKDHLYIKRCGD